MNPIHEINLKILAYKRQQRYAVQKAVIAACEELHSQFPSLQVIVEQVKRIEEIESYTPVTIYPSLVLNGRLVCVGRFPRKQEIIDWLRQVMDY